MGSELLVFGTGCKWEERSKGNLVGNGGYSLRDVREMVKVAESHEREKRMIYHMAPLMSEAEDVFFARRCKNPCPVQHARSFSMEQVVCPEALGYHRFWMYHPVDFTVRFFEKVLQETAASLPSIRIPDVKPTPPANYVPRSVPRQLASHHQPTGPRLVPKIL